MTVALAFRTALGETYRNSLRLLALNSLLSATVAAVVFLVSAFPLVLFIAPLVAGPIVAALVHCVVTLVREESFTLRDDAVAGLRMHWRRGFALGGLFGAGLLLGVVGVAFYVSPGHRVWPLAAVAIYMLTLFALVLLMAWPLAIASPERPLVEALRDAMLILFRAPSRTLSFGAGLFLINLLGAVTVLPLLMLTISYSFLAAAHVVLPLPAQEEVTTQWQA
jgi:uncharacterized membrane protein YesL